jgi:transcriptional regulator with XRE-family HTH domain
MDGSDLIREARLRAGLTQSQLADRVGTSQPAVARWESGRVHTSLATLSDLVRACGFELRLGLSEPDLDTDAQIERNLKLSPAERLDQLVRTVRFIEAGRRALHG